LEGVTIRGALPNGGGGEGVICDLNSTITIRGCVIEGNSTGILVLDSFWPLVDGSTIRHNSVGLFLNRASAEVSNSFFCSNGFAVHAQGNASGFIETSVLIGNGSGVSGSLATIHLANCTVSGNGEGATGWRSQFYFYRSILWGNCTQGSVNGSTGRLEFACSAVDPSSVHCDGCTQPPVYDPDTIFLDPLFCDSRICSVGLTCDGDYHLRVDSPCTASNSPCGELIGALDVGCGATPVQILSWGGLKRLYR
jgi:hypothetical protein